MSFLGPLAELRRRQLGALPEHSEAAEQEPSQTVSSAPSQPVSLVPSELSAAPSRVLPPLPYSRDDVEAPAEHGEPAARSSGEYTHRVLADFHGSDDAECSLATGELVTVDEKADEWWFVIKDGGVEGWAPGDHLWALGDSTVAASDSIRELDPFDYDDDQLSVSEVVPKGAAAVDLSPLAAAAAAYRRGESPGGEATHYYPGDGPVGRTGGIDAFTRTPSGRGSSNIDAFTTMVL